MRHHHASSLPEVVEAVNISTYEMKFDLEGIECIHCGTQMWDYYELDRWPFKPQDFFTAFEGVAKSMVDSHGFDPQDPHITLRGSVRERESSLNICPLCGWWAAVDRAILPCTGSQLWLLNLVSPSVLMEFDSKDVSLPIQEVRNYLSRNYDLRYEIHPRVMEETVASVFRDIGYRAQATAYSNDGGIDVVMEGSGGELIAVQVKRYQKSIDVEQIRSFLGALVLGGFDRGVFVSTSKFRRGAVGASMRASDIGVRIELMDARRFFDALEIAQLSLTPDPSTCGFYDCGERKALLHSCFHLNTL